MKPVNFTQNQHKVILFGVMLSIILGLVFLLATSIIKGDNAAGKLSIDSSAANSSPLSAETDKLLGYNEKLQARMAVLQELDQQYASAITDSAFTHKADSLNELIGEEENVLRGTINSISEHSISVKEETVKARFAKMITSFQALLEGRRAISNLRNAVALQKNNFSPDEKTFLKIQDELMEKNNKIAALEFSIKEMNKMKGPVITQEKNNNTALAKNITELQNSVSVLTSVNSNLKLENEKLQKQQIEISKKAADNEMVLKEKASTLQQKVEGLNADVQLAHVDCNLARVDALQIISNAKQRKLLLSEASDILTNLSVSANNDVKQKVKDKINRLNEVAANSRE